MEMKADIAGIPTDKQFHKIYIQKHENVRYKKKFPVLFSFHVFSLIRVGLLVRTCETDSSDG